MRYFKIITDGYLVSIGKGNGNTEIAESEYNDILFTIQNKPTAQDGYDYRLKEDLTWEEYELPEAVEEQTESSALGVTDDTEILDGITALTRYSNEITGASDSTLSEAVETLTNHYKETD